MKLILVVSLFFLLVLVNGCEITPGKNIFSGQAVAGYSNEGCIQGIWYYEVNGKIVGRNIGCTTMNEQGIKGREDAWCPTKTILQNGKSTYVSGSETWQNCMKLATPCSESDFGKDYFTKGTLTNTNGEKYTDFCSQGDVGSAGAGITQEVSDYVYEYYCLNEKKAGATIEKCSGKCVSGQCISTPIIDSILQTCPTQDDINQFNLDFKITDTINLKYDCVFGVNPNFPKDKLDPRLTLYQSLRVIKSLDFSKPLPWTDKSLYDWLKTTIKGMYINSAFPNSYCCDPQGIVNVNSGVLEQTNKLKWIDSQTGVGMAGVVAVLIHEARHTTHKHTCNGYDDQTLQEMGAWALEYYTFYWKANYLPLNYQTAYEKKELAYNAENIKTTRFC